MDSIRLPSAVTAWDRVRHGILTGQLAAGERLVAQRLAAELGLSRTPVKEALASLEREGLVTRAENWGYSVRVISVRDAQDVFEARLVVETANSFHAAMRATDSQIGAMAQGLQEAHGQLKRRRIMEFQQASRQVHEQIAEASANRMLIQMFRQVNDLVMLVAITSLRALPDRATDILAENRSIVEAIRARNPDLASERTKRHIEAGHEAFRKALAQGNLSASLA
jgi:GntR family transcriptional regulator, vanillate catabolism transcriptional regulator